jgi:hypothetical protein
MTEPVKERPQRASWQAISAAIAILSLAAALVFNGLQVRSSANAQRQSRLATELGLLTQLQDVMNTSVASRVPYARQFQDLRAGRRGQLTPDAYQAVIQEGSNMDYFAWLFSSGYLTAPGADRLWGPRMICEYKQALAPAISDPAQALPNLVQFIQERGTELSRLERC